MATPIRLEAEHFNLEDSLFGLETNDVASGGALISLAGQDLDSRGKVQAILEDLDGTYDVYVGYYDDSGKGQIGVKLDGQKLDYWVLNKAPDDAPANNFYRRKLRYGSDISIRPGQKLELTGVKKDAEDVRIDYIEFVPTGATANQVQPGELSLEQSSYSLYEGEIASQQITVNRTGGSDGAVSATLKLIADSATAADFDTTDITVDFAEGETSKTVTLPILDDAIAEGEENFSISLVNPTGGATLGSQTQAAVTLKDNDIRLEAEQLNLDQFSVETNEISSGNALISLQGSAIDTRGKAQTTLNLNGTYDVFIGYYDESDGQGQMGVKLNGTTLKYWVLNKDLGDTPANSFYRRQLGSDISILPGQKLEITGLKKDDEDVRIDYLEFIPTGETSTTAPPLQAGELAFGASAYSINEDGTATQDVTVIRTGGNEGAVSATIQLEAGTATAADYSAETLTVNFAAGETSKVVSLPIVDDDLVEGEESFSITLLNPTGGATIGSQDQADVTIIDSAQPGQLTFSAENYSLNEDGGTANQVTILRSEGSDGAVSATIQFSAGTATAADYDPEAITVEFDAGETSKTVTLPIINDVLVEGPEQFSISLINPTGGATIGSQNEAQVAIADDEKPGALAFSSDTYNLREGGTATNQITLVRTGGSDGTVSATVQFNANTASAADYGGDPITVTFASGETSKTIPLPITNDALVEAAERFSLSLVNPTGRATLGSQSQANVVIQDNDIRLEAEALNLEHFGTEANSQASGDSLISLANSAIDTRGKARTNLNLSEGNYDVFIGYYDDNSGRGQLGVKLAGTTLKYWTLNKDLGATLGESFYRRQLGSDLSISSGDLLEISGVKKDAEAVRVDYIDFIATGETGATPPPELTPTPGTLAFGAASYSLNEDGTTSNQVTVTRSGGSDGAVSATVQLNANTATTADYDATPITVNFAAGVTSQTITLPIIDDSAVEGEESLSLSLSNPTGGAALGNQTQTTITIIDNDSAAEPPNPPANEPIVIEAESLNLSGSDYVTTSLGSASGGQIISFEGGSGSGRGTVSTELDLDGVYDVILGYYDQNDGAAQMSVTLGGEKLKYWVLNRTLPGDSPNSSNFVERQLSSGSVITPGTRLEVFGLEKDGDSAAVDYVKFVPVDLSTRPGRLEFSQASYIANENGAANAAVTINRIAGTGGTVTTTLSLIGDTATAGSDFNSDPITVSFAPGEETKTVILPLINDATPETTEKLNLQLSSPSGGATLGDITQAQFTIVDDEENRSPRLYIGGGKVDEIKGAIQVDGSHHQLAFAAMKARVDQNDWQIYDENLSDGNKNYARTWLAREASMMYQLTDNPVYGQTAYEALRQVYDSPGFTNANLTSDKGLTRAMVALGFAISYDWAAKAWTPEQRTWVKDRLIEGLDSWESFSHPNVEAPFASNWTAVTRGAELVTMLALGEETVRSDRYDLVKYELEQHILNGYGQYGYNQEGNGYLSYGGSVLATAVNALRSKGDTDLDAAFESKEFWKLPLYGSVFNAEQDSVQYGVGNVRFNAEGWTSFMFADVPEDQAGYYKFAYDLARGVNNPAEDGDKFEHKRAATTWSLIYYPTENVTPIDPDSNPEAFQHLLASDDKGGYFLRNRWQDADDTIVSIMGDFESEPHAWNQPEAFNLGLYAYGDRFIAGPKEETNASAFSTLLVDGKVAKQDHTGQREFHEANATGGYVIIDGGTAYAGLGLDSAKRHLDVEFNPDGSTLLSTLDQVRDDDSHDYTWQINVGESLDDGGISVTLGNEGGLQTFLLTSADGDYVKGWVLEPSNVTLEAGDPLKLTATGADTNLWVAMLTGQGDAPTATVTGSGLNAVLTVDNNRLYYDSASDRIISEYNTNPVQPPTDLGSLDGVSSLQDDLSASNSSDRYSFNLAQTTDFSAILEGLTADANLSLFDSTGTLILSSNNGGNQTEQLSQTLAAGSYELRVDAATSTVTTDYDLILSATADEAGQNRNLEVSAATYLGGAAQDEASAIEISPHNELIVAGNFSTAQGSGQAFLGADSSAAGQLIRMSLSGREVLSVTHLGDDINDMDLNRQTGAIAAGGDFGIAVLNATADQILWSQDLGAAVERVAIANDGTVVTLHNKTVTVWNNDGTIRAEQTLIRSYVNDVAIDPSNGKVYVTGFDNKYNNVDNNPVQVAFINSFDLDLNFDWQTWGYNADILTDDVNGQGQNDMADTRGYRITIGHDGQLYFLGEVAGGNSVFRWNGKDRSTPTQVKYDAYNDPYNSASPHETYYARINPDNGEVDQGQLAFPRYNGAANAFRIEKGSITADENGNIYIGGATFSGIDQRDNNAIAGQDVGPYAFRSEGDLTALVVSSDFQQRRLWTPFTDEAGKGQVQGFAVGQGRAAILGTVVEGTTITSGSSAINPTAFNAGTDALSDVYLATWAIDTATGFASVQYGTSEADNLVGGSTADLLVGGLGADTLQGDTQLAGGGSTGGADTFAYNSAAEGADTILDFGGNDKIRISAAGFGLTAGSAVNLASDSQSLGSNGGFVYSGGQLYFDADGAGAQQSSLLATLTGTPNLSASQIEIW